MAKKALEMTIELAGKVAGSLPSSFNKAEGQLQGLKKASRNAEIELNRLGKEFRKNNITQKQYAENTAKVKAELARTTAEMKRLENAKRRMNSIKNTAFSIANTAKTAGMMSVGAGVAGAAIITKKAVETAGNYQLELSKVQSKTGATKKEMAALSKEALRISANSVLSASDIGAAMDALGAKGMKAKEIQDAMAGIVAGAEASGEDLTLVSDTVTSAMNAYGMGAKSSAHISDVLAQSANNTAAGVYDLSQSFKYVLPVGKALNLEFEEIAAATGLLVDKGLAGEQAGTALRQSLLRLSGTEAKKTLDKLGISAVDSTGKFKSLAEITEDWNKATAKYSDVQKVELAKEAFGSESATAMLNIFSTGSEKLKEMTTSLKNSDGAAKAASDIMKDNFAGAKTQLLSTMETAQIAFATPLLLPLQRGAEGLTQILANNLDNIEAFGERAAKVLDEIIAPFSTVKPEFDPNMKADPEVMKKYTQDLLKYNEFQDMGFGDKVLYSLETAIDKVAAWLDASGGAKIEALSAKVGEMAGKVWVTAFTNAAKGALNSALEGNGFAALGLGAAAWSLGGGTLVKGAMGAGGMVKDAVSKRKSKKAQNNGDGKSTNIPIANTPPVQKDKKMKPENPSKTKTTGALKTKKVPVGTNVKNFAKKSFDFIGDAGKKTFSTIGKIGKKAFIPLSIASEAFSFFKSKDKVKSGASSLGGLGGGLGGGKAGAALGTLIAPGLGTLVGGALGGLGGYLGGKFLGEKAVDTVRSSPVSANATEVAKLDTNGANQAMSELGITLKELSNKASGTARNMAILQQYTGEASGMIYGSFFPLQESASGTARNMAILQQYTGEASGMIYGSFFPLQESASGTASNMAILQSYVGQASGMVYGSFYPLQEKANLVTNNLTTLAMYAGQASGWLNSLNGIQSAGHRVVSALNSLQSRINSIQLPNVDARVKYD